MAQFDVYRLSDGLLVVDVQTDLIGLDATRLVAPLRPSARYSAFPGLTPVVEFGGETLVVRVQEMAAIVAGSLGRPVGSLAEAQDDIKAGIDILIRGF